MWAVGVVGTFLWVVNAVKAQNQAEQEGAPPDADPGGSADIRVQCMCMYMYMYMYRWTYMNMQMQMQM